MRRAGTCSVLALFASVVTAFGQSPTPFTSRPIDPGVFREGSVRRIEGAYGRWNLVCDDVPAIQRRYCSLTTIGQASPADFVQMIVSTGEDGKPAAMLRLPFGLLLKRHVSVATEGFGGPPARRRKPAIRTLRLIACEVQSCFTLFPMSPDEIAALGSNRPIHVRYFRPTRPDPLQRIAPFDETTAIDVTIEGTGFRDALAASQAP